MKKIYVFAILSTFLGLSTSQAVDYTSVAHGDWNNVAFGANNPDTGDYTTNNEGSDSVIIDGHNVTVDGNTYGGADGDAANDRFTVANGNSIIIRGGGSLVMTDTANQEAWIGRRSDGTMSIESGSYSSTGQELRVGTQGFTAEGRLVIGDGIGPAGDATVNLNGEAIQIKQGNNTGAGFLTINSDGQVINSRLLVGNGRDGTAVMNGNATYETNTGTGISYVGVNTNGDGSLTLNDNSVFTYRGTRGFRIGAQGDAQGTVTLNGNAQFIGTAASGNSDRGLIIGRGGVGVLNIKDNAQIILQSPLAVSGVGNNGAGDFGTVNHISGDVSTATDLWVGRYGDGLYTLTSGTVTARDMRMGYERGTGTFTQNGGTVRLTGRDISMSQHPSRTDGDAVYNLLGGTLKVDRINLDAGADNPTDGVFNWGGGTLTTVNRNEKNNPGSIDYTTIDPIDGVGQVVCSGTTISVTGDMATGFMGATSTLDLGGLYSDDGTRVDIMTISGTLDLSGAEHLISVDSPNLLRPIGNAAIDYGSIPLVTATGGITGDWGSFQAPLSDGRPFYASPFAVSDPANLKPNTYYIETTGDTVYFHYKVTGTIPEPGTGLLFGFGVLLIRGLHRMRGKKAA